MQKTLQQLQKLQSSRLPLLLIGETGTGKNVLANYRHRHSERRGEPFLTVNCGALSPTLLESELFGYEKGAFTGAVQRRVGLLEAADGGTLFLDEINSASTELQVRLLQFIQDQTLLRVGARSEIKVDVQLVFATNQDLRPLVDKGAFREDLFFRLNVFPIEIPPLRERLEDISHLAARFLFKHAPQVGKRVESCAPGVLDAMLNYSWPGNVRELENVVLRMLISAQGERIELFDLPPEIIQVRKETNTNLVTPHPLFPQYASLQEIEKIWIEYTLKKFQGNKLRAADALGINSTTLWRKLKQSR
jgi:transcriptional regulator with PAS, ATPase and Fis domain